MTRHSSSDQTEREWKDALRGISGWSVVGFRGVEYASVGRVGLRDPTGETRWFSPELIELAVQVAQACELWSELEGASPDIYLKVLLPGSTTSTGTVNALICGGKPSPTQ